MWTNGDVEVKASLTIMHSQHIAGGSPQEKQAQGNIVPLSLTEFGFFRGSQQWFAQTA